MSHFVSLLIQISCRLRRSLTLDDLNDADSAGDDKLKKSDSTESEKDDTDELVTGLTRGAAAFGISMGAAPLGAWLCGCFKRCRGGNDDVVVPVDQMQVTQEAARQAAHESSRHLAGGYYLPGEAVSYVVRSPRGKIIFCLTHCFVSFLIFFFHGRNTVLKTAAIQAAQSASVSAGQGAAALAGFSGVTGAVATSKLFLALAAFGLLAGGASIAAGAVILFGSGGANGAARTNTTFGNGSWNGTAGGNGSHGGGGGGAVIDLPGGNGSGGNSTGSGGSGSGSGGPGSGSGGGTNGSGDGLGSNGTDADDQSFDHSQFCPLGQVLEDGSKDTCVSAVGVCKSWQHAVDGACRDCGKGQVSRQKDDVNTHEGCVACPNGYVRNSKDGSGLGDCVSAEEGNLCNPWEYASAGYCTSCYAGQVSVVDESSGNATFKGCSFCPDGQVRSSADGSATGPCVDAKKYCSDWQYASNGACKDCEPGKVPSIDSLTKQPTFKGCEYCADGYVRASADGFARGACVPASGVCKPWQKATMGRCIDCEPGHESSRNINGGFTHRYCQVCPNGQVRQDRDGRGLGPCIPARVPDGQDICNIFEAATGGRCRKCATGQATSVDPITLLPNYEECSYCPPGEVRSSANGRALGPCVPAESYCTAWEFAYEGKCNTCTRGQVSDIGSDGKPTYIDCSYCKSGEVRGDSEGRGEGLCVSAVGHCTDTQRAAKGQCINCIEGRKATPDHLECVIAN